MKHIVTVKSDDGKVLELIVHTSSIVMLNAVEAMISKINLEHDNIIRKLERTKI